MSQGKLLLVDDSPSIRMMLGLERGIIEAGGTTFPSNSPPTNRPSAQLAIPAVQT